jgi:hypothetical protein
MAKSDQIAFIIRHASGNADPGDIAQYFHSQSEAVVQEAYQRLLQVERQRIIDADAETQKLKQQAAAQVAETAQALKDYRWVALCAHNFGGKSVANVISNRQIIEGWAQDKQVSPALLQSILDSNPQIKLAWVKFESPQVQRQHSAEQEERTKQVLLDICRRYNYSFSDANISIVLQAFPEGCDAYQLEQAIVSNQVHLHGADWAEIEQHTKDLVKAHNKKWAAKSVSELKQQSAQERSEREAIFSRVAPEPTRPVGITPLPAALTKEVLLEKLNAADRSAINIWKTRYGMDAINARLQGVC